MKYLKNIFYIFGLVVCIISFIFYTEHLWNLKDEIFDIPLTSSLLIIFILSLLVVIFINILGGYFWYRLILEQGLNVNHKSVIAVYMVSQFGKYMPGNIGQFIGRPIFASYINIPIDISISTIFLEFFWTISVIVILSLSYLLFFYEGQIINDIIRFNTFTFVFSGLALLSLPLVILLFINHVLPKFVKSYSFSQKLIYPKIPQALLYLLLILISSCLAGFIVNLQAKHFFGILDTNIIELICLFSFIWFIGFILPGAPGGLGVREALFVLLLSPSWGMTAAVGVGFLFRVTTVVGDILLLFFGFWLEKKLFHMFKFRSLFKS